MVKIMRICNILLIRKQGYIPVYDHYKMFKNRNYNNLSQKRLTKFALIKYRIDFRNYGIYMQRCFQSKFYDISVELRRGFAL